MNRLSTLRIVRPTVISAAILMAMSLVPSRAGAQTIWDQIKQAAAQKSSSNSSRSSKASRRLTNLELRQQLRPILRRLITLPRKRRSREILARRMERRPSLHRSPIWILSG
jgi:hypothetical protein